MFPSQLSEPRGSVLDRVLDKIPSVHLCKKNGGRIMVGASINPKLEPMPPELAMNCYSPTSLPLKFQFVPLSCREDRSIIEPEGDNEFETKEQFLQKMRTEYKYVAIRCCGNGKFLSCRRATYIPLKVGWSSLTEYRDTIGEFECFEVGYHPKTRSFSFLSHNELYLDANRTFWTIACRPKPKSGGTRGIADDRSWTINPLIEGDFLTEEQWSKLDWGAAAAS